MKKYFLLLWLVSLNLVVCASPWDDIAKCISDPCNCGQNDLQEVWDHSTREVKPNALCPPWNKGDGRQNNGNNCLLQFNYPGAFTPFYLQHCAQSTAESTYFTPKIEIRAQNCNSFACWSQDTSLDWDGQCVVWPTGWGLPTLRICARIALPADLTTGNPADPGYTKGFHLDQEGATVPDEVVIGVDGRAIPFDRPKICAYRDPWLLDLTNVDGKPNIDLLDFNPLSQPIHKTVGLHPIAKIMIFLVENASGENMIDMLGMVFSNAGGVLGSGFEEITKKILSALDAIVSFRSGIYIKLIKEFGQFNREVDDYQFGCVEVPMGPYPPPYCAEIPSFTPTATLQTICPRNAAGELVKSTIDNPCVVSNLVNNAIRNSARVTLDNFLPLCSPAVAASGVASDKCVILNNIGSLARPSVMHTITAGRDVIKPCNKVENGAPCALTSVPFSCSVSQNGCQDGFRVVYGTQIGTQLSPNSYYSSDLVDCSTDSSSNCQKIWGINTGEYVDISLLYPTIEAGSMVGANSTAAGDNTAFEAGINFAPLTSAAFALSYSKKDSKTGISAASSINLQATIVRTITSYAPAYDNLIQTPKMMCVFAVNSGSTPGYLAGCVKRQPAPKIKVYDCNSDFAKNNNLTCNTNSFFTPMLIGSIEDGKDSTSAVFEALSYKNSNNSAYQINLAGSDYLALVTDDTYIMKPFSGSHSINPATIYGTYQDDAAPYDQAGKPNKNAVYLTGLEYINNKYIEGGTNVCLQNLDALHCPDDTTNCVLSNLLNNNLVSCADFLNKSTKYNNLRLCTKSNDDCSAIDSMPGKNGGMGIQINQCKDENDIVYYCYNSSNNQEVCQLSLKPNDIYMPSADEVIKNGAYYDVNSSTVNNNSLVVSNNGNNANNNDSVTVDNGDNTTTTYSVNKNSTGLNYDKDLYILRDKTPHELGACVSVLQPKCPAVTDPGPNDGNALWPETIVGKIAQGTCAQNSVTNNIQSLTRYCQANVETGEIKFQPIKAGQGCKMNSINVTSVVNNVPNYLQPQTQTSDSDRSGKVQLNDDHWEDAKKLQAGEYSSKITFNVQGVSSIDYFRITQLAYDDYVLIKVNGNKIYSGPWNFNTLSYSNGQALIDGTSQGDQKGFRDNNFNFSLVPYLVEGTNTIEIKVVVYDVGTIAYLIEYAMKQQQ